MSLTDEPAPGVHRLPIPTPFPVGDVNCYLLTGSPLTLVDTGPDWATALDRLERALAELGLRVEDLELIVVSHQHADHEGLVEIIGRRSGAQLAALDALAPWLEDEPTSSADDLAFAAALARRHGIPDDVVTVMQALGSLRGYGSSAAVTTRLRDGDLLHMGGRDHLVLHRPGHSPSDLVFFDAEHGVLLGGDHLLPHISSNALVTRPLGAPVDAPRPRPLIDYARSLRATRELHAELTLPGHGEPFTDHVSLIDARLSDQERRARKIRELLGRGPLSAHQLAIEMWGRVALTQAYLTLSEVLGHLDILLEDGSVTESDADGLTTFQAS